MKKDMVDPDPTHPYLILVCEARSAADEMGVSIRSMVRKAARLAVYEEIMIRVKNHQKEATKRDDTALTEREREKTSVGWDDNCCKLCLTSAESRIPAASTMPRRTTGSGGGGRTGCCPPCCPAPRSRTGSV